MKFTKLIIGVMALALIVSFSGIVSAKEDAMKVAAETVVKTEEAVTDAGETVVKETEEAVEAAEGAVTDAATEAAPATQEEGTAPVAEEAKGDAVKK